jgi:DnaJ-class molecular chaperone
VGNIFEDFFGSGRQRGPGRGQDVEQTVEISFEEAMRGTTTQLPIRHRGGRMERLQVKIPPGVDTGTKVRVAGKGEPGAFGGQPGDVYIVLKVRPHAYFKRQGNDILYEVPVNLAEAMLGAKIDVPTIDGLTTMTLPAGTQNGQRFRLRGKGVPLPRHDGRGDQYVTVRVVLPEKLDTRSRELLNEFMVRNPLEPRAQTRW